MLTWVFVLTIYLAEMGGGGTAQLLIHTTSKDLCKSLRRAVMSQMTDMRGHAGPCMELSPALPVQPEKD